jgi:hypothetical protein
LAFPPIIAGVTLVQTRDATRLFYVRARSIEATEAMTAYQLDTLISGLAAVEVRTVSSKQELAKVQPEQERLRALASLSAEQLEAIERTLSPGARAAVIVALASIVVGLITWGIGLAWSGELPWQ